MSYTLPSPAVRESRIVQPKNGIFGALYTADQMHQAYAAGFEELAKLVSKVHSAKGRYHTQLAICDLYDKVGLKNERPVK
jgi:hypothetical protein